MDMVLLYPIHTYSLSSLQKDQKKPVEYEKPKPENHKKLKEKQKLKKPESGSG
jgi:hypothetical protein